MAISYVGGVAGGRAGATTTTTQSLSGTLTGGSNSSPIEGDLVVVWMSVGADTTATTDQSVSGNTSGAYSNEALQSQLGSTYDAYGQLSWQFMGATPDTSITIKSSGSARNAQRWAIHVFRGVDAAVWDQTSTTASGTASGRPNPPSISPNTSGAWILWCGASSAATGAAYTAPTDFATNWRGGTTVDTADCMDGFGYYTGWTSGAYDPAAITAGGTTNAADAWVAKTAALKAAVNNYSTTANAGSYTYTGSSADVNLNRALTASSGAYSLSGQSATITIAAAAVDYPITCNAGSYTLTGSSATLVKGRVLTTSAGSYTYTGTSATVLRERSATLNAGSYSYTGSSATLNKGAAPTSYSITALSGAYTHTGASAQVSKGRALTANAGGYSYAGQSVAVVRNRGLTANSGSYAISGQSATIAKATPGAYEVDCQPGSYLVNGSQITIAKASGEVDNGWMGGGAGVKAKDYDFLDPEYWKRLEVPEKVAKAVRKAAKRAVRLGKSEGAEESLKTSLKAQEIAWEAFYADLLNEQINQKLNEQIRMEMIRAGLIQAELIKQQEEEERDILTLLLEL